MTIKNAGIIQSTDDVDILLNNITDGLFVLDKNFNFLYINKAFIDICKLTKKDCYGNNYWDIFPKAKELKFYTEYQKALSENVSVRFEEYATTLDKYVTVSVNPYSQGLIVIFTDTTDLKKQVAIVQERNKQLHDIAQMLSHELRKPVATVLGLYNLLDREDVNSSENREILENIIKGLGQLDTIIKQADAKITSTN